MFVLTRFIITNPKTGLSKNINVDKYTVNDLIQIDSFYKKIGWDVHKMYKRGEGILFVDNLL